jgi:hypothetical protein
MININRSGNGVTKIESTWDASATKAICEIEPIGDGGNSCARFSLKLEGGQIEKGEIEMCGEWERADLLILLKQIVIEMELLDNQK